MKKLTDAALSLWAKKSNSNERRWLPLFVHLADSAALAKRLWNRWLSEGVKQAIGSAVPAPGEAERLFVFLCAAHDIGKATPVFQSKTADFVPGDMDAEIAERVIAAGLPMKAYREFSHPEKTPHAFATQVILEENGCNRSAAVILGAHHGKPPAVTMLNAQGVHAYPDNFHLEGMGKAAWTAVQRELIDFALDFAGYASLRDIPAPDMAAQVLLCGLVIMTDWLASGEREFPYFPVEEVPGYSVLPTRSAAGWGELAFLGFPWTPENEWARDGLFRERFNFAPREMQKAVIKTAGAIHTPGILVLEAPMGGGKTEAALMAAEIFAYKTGRTGVFFALPTQATSDGIFPRICDWIAALGDGGHTLRLAHAKDQFNEQNRSLRHFGNGDHVASYAHEEDGAVVHAWFRGPKKALLADFVVGTIDQLLLAALKQKHVMLRHLGLANKVVIIDECHAYDAYMSQYLEMALRWLGAYRVPVIVLSATLPAARRRLVIDAYRNVPPGRNMQSDPLGLGTGTRPRSEAPTESFEYPVVTFTDGGEVRHESIPAGGGSRKVRLEYFAEEELADRLGELLAQGGCAGVIVNTVRRAQEFARSLRAHFGEESVELLHSRFLAPERSKREHELLVMLGNSGQKARLRGARIVVGTQVLEQSLDIDFDVMITDICPMDLILQRIGRLHRHVRERPNRLASALCLILGVNGEDFDAGAKAVYGEYLLMRTRALLPEELVLPGDIPRLVRQTYDFEQSTAESAPYRKAEEDWQRLIRDKQERADLFRVSPPWKGPRNTLVGWLNTDVPVSDARGEAAVRDATDSLEVLLVQRRGGGMLHFLPGIEPQREIPPEKTPDDELARLIARQSVRLPPALCAPWAIKRTIEELERLNAAHLAAWQESRWLKGSLCLILDETCAASLCGYRLTYEGRDGLLLEKEEDANG